MVKNTQETVIWDLPLRCFHWLLVLAVIGAIASAKNGFVEVHEKFGLTIIGLLVFRFIWGIVGGHHARFLNFVKSPLVVLSYLKDMKGYPHSGHSPLGGYATLFLLLLLSLMAGFGIMANDSIFYDAPFAPYVGSFSNTARSLHLIGEKLIFAAILLHILALVFYRLRLKKRLVSAMIKGGRDASITPLTTARQVWGLILMAFCILAAQMLTFVS